MTHPLRVAIVDDEGPARRRIRNRLASHHDVEIVAECPDGADALERLPQARPDLVFLDVQMPGLDGFELLGALPAGSYRGVIFVTAYDRYALDAFDVCAVDYLLKPFDDERFDTALERARRRLESAAAGDLAERLETLLERRRATPERLVVRDQGRISFVPLDDVDYVEAEGAYVRIHAAGRSHLMRETMTNIERSLPPARFARIHRSRIVNVAHIRELRPLFHGEYVVLLGSGARLRSSRSYAATLKRLAGE